MKELYFLTGNEGKLREARVFFPSIQSLPFDCIEIQHADPRIIVAHKLREAQKQCNGCIIVEDTSLSLEGMQGLPGPLIKWFEKSIGLPGIASLGTVFGNAAVARCLIGYADGEREEFFEGLIQGTIVSPRGENGFGWDKIFVPQGYDKTFAEMTPEEKNAISMRQRAFVQLKNYLDKKCSIQ